MNTATTNNTETTENHAHIVIMREWNVAGVSIGNQKKVKNTTTWKGDNMGLLEQKKEITSKLEFILKDKFGEKTLMAWIDEYDGLLHIRQCSLETREQCAAMCKWYLDIVSEL